MKNLNHRLTRLTRLLIAVTIAANSLPAAHADDELDRRTLSLTGQDVVRIPATRARITIIVENEAKNPGAAQQVVAQRSSFVRNFLQSSKVDRLQAGATTLHPLHANRTSYGPAGTTEIVGYRAQWIAHFEIDADQAGQITDGVVAAGAARITNFQFTASEEALADAQRQALRGAALRAREDANAVLQTLGYKPAEVARVVVNSGGPVQPLGRRAELSAYSADRSQAASTAVEPGFVEVNGSVTLEIAY